MTTPTIPPRPSRAQKENTAASSSGNMDVPKIPPRPKRSIERSISPHRDSFARSPLNDPNFLHNGSKNHHKESRLSAELPPRPPSVTLPSIGQEGSEYANLHDFQESNPEQTKAVAGDLPLHAPTASLPSSAVKTRIQTVTRTDSSQAAAAGIGKLFPDDKSANADSGRSDSSVGRSRPQSIYKEEEEQGIPEIGIQVPMYPNAGDVQAPTPSPYASGPATGIGFFNKGDQPTSRHHNRTKSGREIFHGPPGSYGLHGHGIIPKDDFEQQWYAKHPEDLKKEKQGEYGPHIQENRKDYHWVGDDLVKLVHRSASTGTGMGTSRDVIGTPDEQIGHIAAEQFANRMTSPRPSSGRPPSISKEKGADAPLESPLRQSTFPVGARDKSPEIVSDTEDDVIHIDPPTHSHSKVGYGSWDPPTEKLGPEGGNTEEEGGWIDERGYGVPILASDEVAKNPEAEYMLPAVSPELERRGDGEYTINDPERRGTSRSSSRNRNNDKLKRASPSDHDRTSTPLEHVREYEPLFPEDEDERPQKPLKSPLDKLKRPDLARHHFPSQDVWEDTPSSLQLETTVETPDVVEEAPTPTDEGAKPFEKPEAKKVSEDTPQDGQNRLTKSVFNKDVLADIPGRPGIQHRFPSQDIWEDAADHHHLVTTVSGPQEEETAEDANEPDVPSEKPQIPARPSIPSRPQKQQPSDTSPVEKKAPGLPEKPKPSIPARPARPTTKSSEKVPTTSAAQESLAAISQQSKPKPPVPARPGGSKIAALQAGFLKDLNSKLGLGPQAPKPKEPEPDKEAEEQAEAKPLQDARKGRAKGPQRRKPTASPAAPAAAEKEAAVQKFEIVGVNTVWSIREDGSVDVPAQRMAEGLQAFLAGGKKAEVAKEESKETKEETVAEPEVKSEPKKEEESDEKGEEEKQDSGVLHKVSGAASKVASVLGSRNEDKTEDKTEESVKDDAGEEKGEAVAATDASDKEKEAEEEKTEVAPEVKEVGQNV